MADAELHPLARALRERVIVVLVEPQYPGNVGATARAMRNMGLWSLVLVAPPAYDAEQARWMAPGCAELLASARIVATLDEALAGVSRVVATTARHRKRGQPVLEPREAAALALDDDDGVTALLFGREDQGLDGEAVDRAQALLRIPTLEHASLNLSQAVMVTAHAFFEEARARGLPATGRMLGGSRAGQSTRAVSRTGRRDRRASLDTIEPAAEAMVQLLERVGYTRGTHPTKVRVSATTALQSAQLRVREVEALRGMVRRIEWALDNPGTDWTRSARDNRDDT